MRTTKNTPRQTADAGCIKNNGYLAALVAAAAGVAGVAGALVALVAVSAGTGAFSSQAANTNALANTMQKNAIFIIRFV
jgi:hypothetical protein